MITTYVCMTAGGMDAESAANGLIANINALLGGDSKSARRIAAQKGTMPL
jgi:hypothetical protein